MTPYWPGAGETAWHKSLSCESGGCVVVARNGESILLGNSSDPDGPITTYTQAEWSEFVKGIKRGDFDDLV
jgi:hypothetical protein